MASAIHSSGDGGTRFDAEIVVTWKFNFRPPPKTSGGSELFRLFPEMCACNGRLEAVRWVGWSARFAVRPGTPAMR